jgi:hypothetical protein
MKRRTRTLEEECPRCKAPRGQRCRNYLGKGKAPCPIKERMTEGEKRARKAERITAREKEQAGLFAHLVEETTEKDLYWKSRRDKARAAMWCSERTVGQGGLGRLAETLLREEAKKVLPAEEIAGLDAKRSNYPKGHEYGTSMWREVLQKVNPAALSRFPVGGPPGPMKGDRGDEQLHAEVWQKLQKWIKGG